VGAFRDSDHTYVGPEDIKTLGALSAAFARRYP